MSKTLLFILVLFVYVHNNQGASDTERCFSDAVSILSEFDSLLCGRLAFKERLLKDGATRTHFLTYLSNFTSNGTDYFSDGTSDWLSEILLGLDGSYADLTQLSVYKDLTTENILDYFKSHFSANSRRIFFKMRLTGAFPRGWLIEQLSNGQGYRVYQSTSDAYSLKAWMNNDINQFVRDSFWSNRHLMGWEKNYKRIEKSLNTIHLSLNEISKARDSYRPWMTFVKNYNQNRSHIIHNLRRSWGQFGAGRVISPAYFQQRYLELLHNMTSQLQRYMNNRHEPWTVESDDTWINLFGSPNKHCFPNQKFTFDTGNLKTFVKLEVRVIQVPTHSASSRNARLLARSVLYDSNQLGTCSNANMSFINFYTQVLFVTITFLILMK